MFLITRSGKAFKGNLDLGVEYSPLFVLSNSDYENSILKTPRGAL